MSSRSDKGPIAIRWERRALDEAASLARVDRVMIAVAVESLRESPLKGELLSGQWKGLLRLRIGDFRVMYAFDGKALLILVLRVRHCKQAHRGSF